LKPILKEQVSQSAHLMTDDAKQYLPLSPEFAKHDVVNHSAGEYVRVVFILTPLRAFG